MAWVALHHIFTTYASKDSNPDYSPATLVIAGGSAAVIVLFVVMSGFQFLTVGTTSPDLAYPSPLLVCALGALSGVGGRQVIDALQGFVQRTFSTTTKEHDQAQKDQVEVTNKSRDSVKTSDLPTRTDNSETENDGGAQIAVQTGEGPG